MGEIRKESKVCCVSWSVLKEVETSERVGGGGEGTPVSSDRDDRMGAKIIIIIIIIIINY